MGVWKNTVSQGRKIIMARKDQLSITSNDITPEMLVQDPYQYWGLNRLFRSIVTRGHVLSQEIRPANDKYVGAYEGGLARIPQVEDVFILASETDSPKEKGLEVRRFRPVGGESPYLPEAGLVYVKGKLIRGAKDIFYFAAKHHPLPVQHEAHNR